MPTKKEMFFKILRYAGYGCSLGIFPVALLLTALLVGAKLPFGLSFYWTIAACMAAFAVSGAVVGFRARKQVKIRRPALYGCRTTAVIPGVGVYDVTSRYID